MNFIDRLIAWAAPQWGANRARARMMARHFEAASVGRRTDGWHRLATDANAAAAGNALSLLRGQARDLVRNNPWARHGLRRLVANTVGWGIRPKATGRGAELVAQRWKDWAETTQCDAAGRLTMYGLQRLVMRTVVESGEVLIRRRYRLLSDGLAIPMQLQVLEPDFLDTGRDMLVGESGGPIIQGIEFDAIGRRAAYWLFDRHPGGLGAGTGGKVSPISKRIPADGVLHVFDQERAGQVRGPSWFASVDVLLHDFGEFQDATIVKQKIAACLTAFVTDLGDGQTTMGQGGIDSASTQPTDLVEPGAIIPLAPGKQVTMANPPQATDYQSFSTACLRGVAAGLGVTYEDLTGDYTQVNYSSGRLGRLAHQQDVQDWQWNMLIPQFCVPAWDWMVQAMIIAGAEVDSSPAEWHPAPMPLLDPELEGKANQLLVRTGQKTWPQLIREQGEDPDAKLAEMVEFNKKLDHLGIALDCDPRRMTAAGGVQQVWSSGSIAAWPPPPAPETLAASAHGGKPNGVKPNGSAAPTDVGGTDASGDTATS